MEASRSNSRPAKRCLPAAPGGYLALVLMLAGTPSWGDAALSAESHRYIEVTGDRQSTFVWRLEDRGETIEITAQGSDEESWCRCDRMGAFSEWRVQAPARSIAAWRSGDCLRLLGMQAGKAVDRQIPIDGAPWYQALSYSLRGLARAEAAEPVEFWIVRPDDLTAIKMQARYRGRQSVVAEDGPHEAHTIRISPVGLLARLWHGDYWFRIEDGVLLRYEGTHGLPGTPRTVIHLAITAKESTPGKAEPPGE